MDGVPGELGEMSLVLDERARERLAEGRRLLGVIVSEHGRLRQAAVEEGWRLGSDRPAVDRDLTVRHYQVYGSSGLAR